MEITQSDFDNWWKSPVGYEVRKMLNERKNKIAHSLANGAASGSPAIYDENVGRYREIEDLLTMTFQELMGDV